MLIKSNRNLATVTSLLAAVAVYTAFIPAVSLAEEVKIEVSSEHAQKEALDQLKGKSVTLRLRAGDDLTGVVEATGPTTVKIAQLAGKEFFSAIVKIEDITAIIYRAK